MRGGATPHPAGADASATLSPKAGGGLFAKPSLDNMGPGTDMPTPAGAIPRSLFKKQSHDEAHGADYGLPDDGRQPLFRKNSLDEMTVRRTEKPVAGAKPSKPPEATATRQIARNDDAKPVNRERAGIGSYEDPADAARQKRRPGKTGRPGR